MAEREANREGLATKFKQAESKIKMLTDTVSELNKEIDELRLNSENTELQLIQVSI